MFNVLKPGYRITPILIAINILVFLSLISLNGSYSNFSVQSVLQLGANYSPLVENGQWWRLLSSVFLHLSVTHLLFNTISLHILGKLIEPLLGSTLFVCVYLVTGIIGSTASYIFNQDVISAGASGAIFGLFGIFASLMLTKIFKPEIRKQMINNIGTILVINIGLSLFFPVDNAAHIGGLISGTAVGVLLLPHIKRQLMKILLKNETF